MKYKILLLAGAVFVLASCRAASTTESPTQPSSTALITSTASGTTNTITATSPASSATAAATAVDTPAATNTAPSNQPTQVTALPNPAEYDWQPVLQGLTAPVFVTGAGDGSNRLFVVQQSGQIMVARDGQLLEQHFLDISDRTTRPRGGGSYGEQGLLGLAFHPQFAQNGYFYVNYTDQKGDTHISRFQVQPDNPDQADPASEFQLLFVDQPYPNHNGGMLEFGPDGYLYIGLGDGGSAGDPEGHAQSKETLLGKILRIDVNSGDPYGIPADNPFASGGGLPEIWAYGLRNPWRFSFDRLTNDLYIADVGQNQWEEVNFIPAGNPGGTNFGWDYFEADHQFEGQPPEGLTLTSPVAEYSHSQGCSVTGGYVYRGMNLPAWQGVYLYGDYCTGLIWGLLHASDGSWQNDLLFQTGMNITSFGLDESGELYLTDYQTGAVYHLTKK